MLPERRRHRLGRTLITVGIVVGLAAVWWLVRPPVLTTFLVGVTGFNLLVAGAEARWRLYGYRTPEAAGRLAWPTPVAAGAERLAFDLIVPARDEAGVIAATLRGLLRQQHPDYRIVVSLCDDDVKSFGDGITARRVIGALP